MKYLLRLLVVLMMGSAYAQSNLTACQGSDVSKWTNCFGTETFPGGAKYVGEFKDGKRNGQGTASYPNGEKHVGEWRNFLRNGLGIAYRADGTIINSGQWADGRLAQSFAIDTNRFPFNRPIQTASAFSTPERVQLGSAAQSQLPACQGSDVSRWTDCFGTYTNDSGSNWVGEFKDGKLIGQGRFTFARGERFVGEFKDGKLFLGIHYRNDGTIISSGQWADGKLASSFLDTNRFPFNPPTQTASATQAPVLDPRKEERDRLAYAALSKLPECTIAFKQNCAGTETYSSGYKYVGEFKDGARQGQGTMTFANGGKYVGEWLNGMRYGQGIEYNASGLITAQGRWQNNALWQSFAIDAQRFPFNSSLTASATQPPTPDPIKAERDSLAADLEASRKNAKDLEERLAAAQALTNNPPNPAAGSVRNAHALVIGNAAYPGSGRLDNPVNDANAISQKLRSMGFTVTMVTDANRQRLVQAMAQFGRSAASADLSLLFYSGHGVQIFGTNYILPTDVDQTDTAQATIQGVRLNEVIGNFMPGKTKIVFLDACRDNPLQRTGDRSVTKGLAPISAAEGTLISYATKDGQTAADGVGSKNSPFTQALLEHLNDPQDIGVVLRKVREKVMRATGGKQQPWEYGSLTGGELVLSAIKPK
jgi:hypothetical protein